ncbi:hypothetical protein ACFXPS_17570 [Nocardia sp. NPDC059091]|uniref:hypothetical protein n=1 Tax=unclassified Nocardia TaxID=2637762 RepID=UPI0036B3A126
MRNWGGELKSTCDVQLHPEDVRLRRLHGRRSARTDSATSRFGDRLIRTGLLAARFDAAVDITLEELRIELVYPLDLESADFFRLH